MLQLEEAAPLRFHEFLYEHWNKLRGDRPFPLMNELEQEQLAHIWDYCFIADMRFPQEAGGVRYFHYGKEFSEATGDDALAVQYLFGNPVRPIALQCHEVAEAGRPMIHKAEFPIAGRKLVRYRQCILPLDDGSGQSRMVAGCVRWRVFQEHEIAKAAAYGWDDAPLR